MRSNEFILLAGLLFVLFIDTILFFLLKKKLHKRKILYWIHSLFFLVGLISYHFIVPNLHKPDIYVWIGTAIGILFLFYIPKIVFIVLDLIAKLIGLFNKKAEHYGTIIAISFSSLCFIVILHGITVGRYNYKIEKVPVCFSTLPKAFDNFTIVQLSDMHLGSHTNHYKGIAKLIKEINALHPDLIVFTGDMVNNFASEISPWIDEFKLLKAKYGKYAVTGNHDYGDYTKWNNPEEKAQNMVDFYQNMQEMGFTMLNNRNIPLVVDSDSIFLAGVENWGAPPFPKYGQLVPALEGVNEKFTIMLSHDPSHWQGEIIHHRIPLTLSGHTHAMQMGVKIGNYEWSPAKYLYPQYDGLYQQKDQFLYVSRGQGYLGFPGRLGLRPIITVLTLKKT